MGRQYFRIEDQAEWEPIVREMASQRIPVSTIAHRFGTVRSSINKRDDILGIIREEWAKYDSRLIREMNDIAFDDPQNYSDNERYQVRASKLKMLTYLHSQPVVDVEPPAETMTAEEIKQKIAALLEDKS